MRVEGAATSAHAFNRLRDIAGIVREVYSIGAWHAAGTTRYETRPLTQVAVPGRWEFSGEVAPDAVRQRYLGQSLAHYFAKGSASPVVYVNIK
jgi:hypothetical protein